MNRNQRRLAHDLKRSGFAVGVPCIARGNHLAAQNDEPEPNLAALWTGLPADALDLERPADLQRAVDHRRGQL